MATGSELARRTEWCVPSRVLAQRPFSPGMRQETSNTDAIACSRRRQSWCVVKHEEIRATYPAGWSQPSEPRDTMLHASYYKVPVRAGPGTPGIDPPRRYPTRPTTSRHDRRHRAASARCCRLSIFQYPFSLIDR